MIIRRSMLALTAAAFVLTGCAGTDADPADTEGAAAEQDDTSSSDEVEEPTAAEPEVNDADDENDDAMADDEHDDAMADDEHDDAMADDENVDRVVELDMDDMSFSVQELEVTVGERVRFVFENVGAAPHEALIGDLHVQEEHEQEMADGGGHDDGGHHDDLSMISLEPGESGSFVHEFTEPGDLWMGCHVPGHWAAGMRTEVTVTG